MCNVDVEIEILPYELEVNTRTNEYLIFTDSIYGVCVVWIGEQKILVVFITLTICGDDVMLGMG